MNALPKECQQLVNAFARGWQPTPSAQAVQAFWRRYPWVQEMQQQMLHFPISAWVRLVLLYSSADVVGTTFCTTCNTCLIQRLYDIRAKYEPELQDLMWL